MPAPNERPSVPKPILLNAFEMMVPVHQSPGLWRHPDSGAHRFGNLDYWTDLARALGVSREHIARQFGAGGAPNLKRVVELCRVAAAAQLLANPGCTPADAARLLHFASAAHLATTARRIAGVGTSDLAGLGPGDVLRRFVRGRRGRSRV